MGMPFRVHTLLGSGDAFAPLLRYQESDGVLLFGDIKTQEFALVFANYGCISKGHSCSLTYVGPPLAGDFYF